MSTHQAGTISHEKFSSQTSVKVNLIPMADESTQLRRFNAVGKRISMIPRTLAHLLAFV